MAQYHNQTPLVNANDATAPILLAQDKSCTVSIQTDHNNPAGAVLVLQFTLQNPTTTTAPIWLTLVATDPTSGAASLVSSYTGADKSGVVQFNASSLNAIRVQRTDGTGGNAFCTIGVSQS